MLKKNKKKGVTLVGVLVGITILSIALAAQIRLLGSTVKRDAELRSLIIATNLAREGIEMLFSLRISDGWQNLISLKNQNKDICMDIQFISGSTCLSKKFDFVSHPQTTDFKAYLYDITSSEFDVPPFWRVMRVEDCTPADENKCLKLVAASGWEECTDIQWGACLTQTPDKCSCKLIKLEKKIYNWYVP